MKNNSYHLVLASESPRRKKLLSDAGFKFEVFPVNISEKLEKNLNLDDQIIKIANDKLNAAIERYKPLKLQDYLILTADTMVTLEGYALGKPTDKKNAFEMLKLLSGRNHTVKTSLCLYESSSKKIISAIESTKVHFRNLSDSEINEYIESGEPMDKAGSYGIQGLGGTFIDKYEGYFDNVMGLPVEIFKKILDENNWKISE